MRVLIGLGALLVAACGQGAPPEKAASAAPPEGTVAAAQSVSAPQAPASVPASGPGKKTMTVYKSPTCGCCEKWIEHMSAKGYDVKAIDVEDVDTVKRTYGVPATVQSCHTALIDGYVIEGHVPAETVSKLLRERPALAGIAVGGMPIGSPGMEVPQGIVEPYIVSSFDKKGQTAVYEKRE